MVNSKCILEESEYKKKILKFILGVQLLPTVLICTGTHKKFLALSHWT
jgi:hypothetical protein